MLFSDVRQVVGEFARGSVRINDEGVSLGGVDRVVDGVGCSLTSSVKLGVLEFTELGVGLELDWSWVE